MTRAFSHQRQFDRKVLQISRKQGTYWRPWAVVCNGGSTGDEIQPS